MFFNESADAEAKGIKEGDSVIAFNQLGESPSSSMSLPECLLGRGGRRDLVAEHCRGLRSVNALTSQRLTDQGGGSTFYDNTVDVRKRTSA